MVGSLICTGKDIVTQENKATFPQYSLRTELFQLVGNVEVDGSYEYKQIVLDKNTLKQEMRAGGVTVRNLKLSADGRLILDNSYDRLVQHIQNEILSSSYLIDQFTLDEYREEYDQYVDNETGEFLKKNPDFDGYDLSELYEAAVKSLQNNGKIVYWFTFNQDQDETRFQCASCNLKTIMEMIINTVEYDAIYPVKEAGEFDFDNTLYPIGMSEKYRAMDFEEGNSREKLDYLLEINECDIYDIRGFNFWLSNSLRDELRQALNKSWLLEDELKKIAGCIKAIESSRDFKYDSTYAKQTLTKIILACHTDKEVIRKTSKNVADHGFYQENELSKEERLLERYIAYKLINKLSQKDKSQVVYCGLHEVLIKTLNIKIQITPNEIIYRYIGNESNIINSVFE